MELAKYKACICEGAAENAVMDILLDADLLVFSREEMLEEAVIRCREGNKFEQKYLRKGFADKISVIRILDSRREKFKIGKAYEHKIDVINVITAPEIEMLIIFAENQYKEFKKSGKKPSDFCKENLRMPEVKSYDYVFNYFSDSQILVSAIKEYHRTARIPKGEYEPERRAQTKSYMWLFRSGEDGGPPIILYKYSETRAGDNAVDFLHGFKGYLMCDGYSGYNKVPDAKRTACWAHIRRYLTDAIPKGKALDYTQPSVQGMLYINQLFHLEDVIRSKYSSFDAIKKARLEKEKPLVEGFLSWLDQQNPIRGSRMDKAVTYIQNRRSYLSTYLEDGRCSFSNNLSENAIRPFTVGRKNWLFCDTPNGAQASAIVYTMVEMAKANGVNVYHYLTYLLEKLPDDRMSDDELEFLAPWDETVKAEIERRANESNQSYVNCQGAPATEK